MIRIVVYKTRKQGTVGFYNKQSYTFANKEVYSKTELSICMGRRVYMYCKRKEEPTSPIPT